MNNYNSIFTVHETSEGIPFYILNRRIQLPTDKSLFIYDSTTASEDTPWTILSYQLYNTIEYWWVLSALNPKYKFYAPLGENIIYIKKEYINELLNSFI
jgi:hypothetical protein